MFQEELLFKHLDFRPLKGLFSPHLQTVFTTFSPAGHPPESTSLHVKVSEGDILSCKISTPKGWTPNQLTVALLHGLGGSEDSHYMIRLSRKFHHAGVRSVRINLRGCGSGVNLNKLPYTCGDSHDIKAVLETLKNDTPHSPIHLIGFSLGGNIIMKMAGELGDKALELVDRIIAVCPVIDLANSLDLITKQSHGLYHRYYLSQIREQGKKWIRNMKISSIYEYDKRVTVPLWGYANNHDYYDKCSSRRHLSNIKVTCDLLMAADDPFIDYSILRNSKLSLTTNAWLSRHGGHMGFIGRSDKKKDIYWLDHFLVENSKLHDITQAR
jgi:uncharacterized protein